MRTWADDFCATTGHDLDSRELDQARRILSQLARQGRAVGIHVVLATQRPDSRALDTQVKANLTGILCFAMSNNTSSVTVLDSGKAALLPDISGRAIWKQGCNLREIQTPYLSVAAATELLAPYKKPEDDRSKRTSRNPEEPSAPLEIDA